MARGSLASPAVVDLLRPLVIVAAHSGREDASDLEPAVREIFTKSELSRDPDRLNVLMFALDPQGRVVHEFHRVPGGRRAGPGRSERQAEIEKARAKLKLPEVKPRPAEGPPPGLPDLQARDPVVPAGVRLFIRQDEDGNSVFSKLPVVEVVPMKAGDWKPL